MKHPIIEAGKELLKLINFVAWYVVTIAGMFYVLPMAGLFLEDRYDALARPAKLVLIIGFFAAIGFWQMKNRKAQITESSQNRMSGKALQF